MSDTIITLLKNIIKDNRIKSMKEIHNNKKLNLIKNDIIKEFKKGIPINIYLSYLTYYLDDKIIFDTDEFDYIIINIGTNILKNMINKLVYFDEPQIYGIDCIKDEYLALILSIYSNNDIITCLEYSDNEGRIVLVNKYKLNKHRTTTKIYNDFAFYDLFITDI
jgi:hypothetical protein